MPEPSGPRVSRLQIQAGSSGSAIHDTRFGSEVQSQAYWMLGS